VKDTPERIEKIYNNMLLQQTPEKRMEMVCSMFDFACSIAESSFPKGLSDTEKKQRLFLRFYGNDFDDETKNKILRRIGQRNNAITQ